MTTEQELYFLEGESRYGGEQWSRDRIHPRMVEYLAQALPQSLAGARVPVVPAGERDPGILPGPEQAQEGVTFLAEEVLSNVLPSRPGALLVRIFGPPHLGDEFVMALFGVAADNGSLGMWNGFEQIHGVAPGGRDARCPAAPWVRLHIVHQPRDLGGSGWSVMKWNMATAWMSHFACASAWAWLDCLPEHAID